MPRFVLGLDQSLYWARDRRSETRQERSVSLGGFFEVGTPEI
jgi:hypothetical protein